MKLTEARYGSFYFPQGDQYIGKCLDEYGEWSNQEVDLIKKVIKPDSTLVEIGSNIGSHTVPLAKFLSEGQIIAAEPQRLIHQVLCANLILNGVNNVWTYNAAVGAQTGTVMVPEIDSEAAYNFGGVRVGKSLNGSKVNLISIDQLELERCDFIKIDAEDCEPQVLLGAFKTIKKFTPYMLIEFNDHMQTDIKRVLKLFNYRAWIFNEPLFNPSNFKSNQNNLFPNIVSKNLFLSLDEIPGVTTTLKEIKI